jgi:hypothetical protein
MGICKPPLEPLYKARAKVSQALDNPIGFGSLLPVGSLEAKGGLAQICVFGSC